MALPVATSAFWPFPSAKAANEGGEPPVIHDSSLPLLEAAVNPDPDPTKGDSTPIIAGDSALIATGGPDGTVTDIPSGSSGGTVSTYTVKSGDSFSSIAAENGISVNTVLWANNLTAKSTLKPGQTLVILPVTGIEHTVQKGETVASIAKKYSGDVQDILSYNGLDSNESLVAGSTIIIPDGAPAVATTATTKTTTTAPKSTTAKKPTAAARVSLPAIGGFTNPLPSGICTQGIHDNNGVDIGAPKGTPIYAAAAGSVIIALDNGGWNGGFGNYVVINHPNGTQTLYAHMSAVATVVGASVSQGQLIGYVGMTGKATGNHLHFEVHKAKNPFCGNL